MAETGKSFGAFLQGRHEPLFLVLVFRHVRRRCDGVSLTHGLRWERETGWGVIIRSYAQSFPKSELTLNEWPCKLTEL